MKYRARGQVCRVVAMAMTGLCWSSLASAAATCVFDSTGPAFGIYDPLSTSPKLANGSVRVDCTYTGGGASNISVTARYSVGFGTSYTNRFMLSGANRLYYNIYFDAAFTSIRGDGTGGSQVGTASLRVNRGHPTDSSSSTIYGRIPAGQDVRPGVYGDTITVTVTY